MVSHWVGTWAATPAPADGMALRSPTIRMFPRISIGGDTIQVRLSNAADRSDVIAAHPSGSTNYFVAVFVHPPERPDRAAQSTRSPLSGCLTTARWKRMRGLARFPVAPEPGT
jgi:hypothetical protein